MQGNIPEVSPEAQKLINVLGELAEVNRQTAANIRAIRETSTIHDMVAGIQPCALVTHICEIEDCGSDNAVACEECDLWICRDCRDQHWLDEHQCGNAKFDNNMGVTR